MLTEKVLVNSSRDCIARVVDQGSMPAETEDVDAGLGRNASCRAGTGAGPPQHAQQQDGHTCLQQHYNCMPAAAVATARQPGDTGTGGSLSAPSPAASAGQQPPQGCPGQPRYRTCELCAKSRGCECVGGSGTRCRREGREGRATPGRRNGSSTAAHAQCGIAPACLTEQPTRLEARCPALLSHPTGWQASLQRATTGLADQPTTRNTNKQRTWRRRGRTHSQTRFPPH